MGTVSGGDLVAVLEAVRVVSAATRRDEFGLAALRAVNGLVRSDVTSLNEVDPAAGRLVFLAEPASFVFPTGSAEVLASLAAQHPLIRHYLDTGDGSAVRISDFLTLERWHGSELFRMFYGPLGLDHQMAIVLPAPLPIVVGMALNRAGVDFDERDREVLDLFRPHLAQAWRRAREYERLDALLSAASGALVAEGAGVVVLADPVHELTPGALVALYRFFGRPGPRDPLPPRVRRWLETKTDHRQHETLALARPLRATLDGRHLTLRHLPAAYGQPDAVLLDEQPVEQPATALRESGLTEREVTVLSLVGAGITNAEIARQLSLSPWTIKRHLANIYSKLGVTGRVRATALAMEITAHHRETGPSRDG